MSLKKQAAAAAAVIVTAAAYGGAFETVNFQTGASASVAPVARLNSGVGGHVNLGMVSGLNAAAEMAQIPGQVGIAAARNIKVMTANPMMQAIVNPKGGSADVRSAALNATFENSGKSSLVSEVSAVVGHESSLASGLVKPAVSSSRQGSAAASSPLGYGAYYAANADVKSVVDQISQLAKRAWDAMLGWVGVGVHKAETPEALAERIKQELHAEDVKFNNAVEGIAEKEQLTRMKVDKYQALVNDLQEKAKTAVNTNQDDLAKTVLREMNTNQALLDQEKAALAELHSSLEKAKAERDDFYNEKERELAQIEIARGKLAVADAQIIIGKMKADFGGSAQLKDLESRFEDVVNEKIAKGKGTEEAANSTVENRMKDLEKAQQDQKISEQLDALKKSMGQNGSGETK